MKSSNGTFINGERLSPEGLESDPFELKTDDIVVRDPGVRSVGFIQPARRNSVSTLLAKTTRPSSTTKWPPASSVSSPNRMPKPPLARKPNKILRRMAH